MNRTGRSFGFYIIVIAIFILMIFWWRELWIEKTAYINYTEFSERLAAGEIRDITINQNSEVPTGVVEVVLDNGLEKSLYVSDVNDFIDDIKDDFPGYTLSDVKRENWFSSYMIPILIMIVFTIILFMFMNGQAGGGSNAKMMNFGKSRAKLSTDDNKIRFADVAGLEEEKADLEEIVDFLKNPKKYVEVGARIPKGVILVGPPGTGKTLIAKAVAGEAGVPFFSISGSDFVEMFVGVGASRVRDLFAEAKKSSPCIVFIDEIDAVARRRGTGMGGGHDEREQTLNQLLVEMDGFGVNEGIIVLAATNRVDILDPAIMRPGRFDRKVTVSTPDVKGRKEIIGVHVKNKPLAEDVDIDQIAHSTAGFTGADLENLMNESAILAAKQDRKFITMEDVKSSFVKVGIGTEKKSKLITEKDKKITAYHEAGHAILMHLLEGIGPVYIVSVIPTGPGALGYTMPLPERDDVHQTKSQMLNHIKMALGGRIAEELIFHDVTSGASQDIKDATKIARDMVTKFGMSDKLGMINYSGDDDEVFIGRDLAHTRTHSEMIAGEIDEEVKRIMNDCYEKATNIIKEHMDVLEKCAALLIEKEKINREEFEALFG